MTEVDLAALDAIKLDRPAPNHVPRDRVVDLTFAMGGVQNTLIDPYAPAAWLSDPAIPRLLFNSFRQRLGGLPN